MGPAWKTLLFSVAAPGTVAAVIPSLLLHGRVQPVPRGAAVAGLALVALGAGGINPIDRQRHLDGDIVGDTLFDVAAARAIGARCLAVATGRSTIAELRATGADCVLPSLADTRAVLQRLLE